MRLVKETVRDEGIKKVQKRVLNDHKTKINQKGNLKSTYGHIGIGKHCVKWVRVYNRQMHCVTSRRKRWRNCVNWASDCFRIGGSGLLTCFPQN